MGSLESILAEAGPVQLHRFGVSLGVAFLAAAIAGVRGARRLGLSRDEWGWLAVQTALAAMVAARIGYVLPDAGYYAARPWEIFWPPIEGFSFVAGLAGGLAWIAFAARRRSLGWLELIDCFAVPYVTALLVGASLWAGPVGEARLVAWGRWVVDPLYLTGAFLLLWWSRVNRERRPGALAALVVAADGSLRFLLGTVVSLGLPGGWPSLLPVHAGRLAIALAGAAALWILGGRRAFGPPKLGTGRSWGRWSGWILLYAALLAVALLSNG